jgi:hypothetical protein
MSRRWFLLAIVLAAAVAAASPLRAQQPGANPNPNPNLLRFCPGSGIPCVEITREAYNRGHDQFRSSCGFAMGRRRRAATAGQT